MSKRVYPSQSFCAPQYIEEGVQLYSRRDLNHTDQMQKSKQCIDDLRMEV